MGADDLPAFLAILFDKHDVSPRGSAEVARVVVRIARPNKAVIRHMVPFFARYLARFTADAHGRISEETNLDIFLHVRMPALIRAVCAFADHGNRDRARPVGAPWFSREAFKWPGGPSLRF